MSAWAAGVRLGTRRLVDRSVLWAVLAAVGVVAVAARLERREVLSRATDMSLLGAAFGVAAPLLGYFLVLRIFGSGRAQNAFESMARHGMDRRFGVLGLLTLGGGTAALGTVLIAITAVLAAAGGAPSARELWTCGWIGALGGVAYFGLFAAGATFGKRGGGSGLTLALDWILGMSTTVIAVPWPRAHLRNLLGAAPVADMSQWQASVALLVIVLVGAGVALLRTPH